MNGPKDLKALIAEERAASRDPGADDATWRRLNTSIMAGVVAPFDLPPIDPNLLVDPSSLAPPAILDPTTATSATTSGVSAATAGSASSVGPAAGAAVGAGSGGAAGVGAGSLATTGILGSALTKGIGVVALVVGGGAGGAYVATQTFSTPAVQVQPVETQSREKPANQEQAAEQPGIEQSPTAPRAAEQASLAPSELGDQDDVPREQEVQPLGVRASPHKPQPSSRDRAFDSELKQIRKAQGALAAGKNDKALNILEQHEEGTASGQFSEDREAVRALALCRKGAPQAKSIAKQFLARHPDSVYVDGVRAACLTPNGESPSLPKRGKR